jgi:hypothetical protein
MTTEDTDLQTLHTDRRLNCGSARPEPIDTLACVGTQPKLFFLRNNANAKRKFLTDNPAIMLSSVPMWYLIDEALSELWNNLDSFPCDKALSITSANSFSSLSIGFRMLYLK